ncbi:hypothetical protein F5883DRAFT_437770 [Diaporthe sp. PMI_573]|nr:hypothetical protein F5883DRAFT_437770 [Diaporthaceae sp. PMI_573]
MSDSELVDGLFLLLPTFLSTEWTAPRQPYKFLEHVRAASSAPSHDTSRIFLESGFKAWVAYFVVSPTTANVGGQANRRRQFAALDRLPVSEKKKFASFGNNLLATANPACAADPRAMSNLMPAWTHHQLPSWVPRRKAHVLTSYFTGQYNFVPTFSSTVPSPSSLQVFTDIARGNINSSTSPKAETLVGADIAELNLFPKYLAGAIQKYNTTPKTATIAIQFPANSIVDINCAMIIKVLPNKVERLASLLFSTHLETNRDLREVILPGSLYIVPTQLQGSLPESVAKVFGATTAATLKSAPYRKIEVSEAGSRVATCCITMSEYSNAKKGAVLKVAVGRREASKIYEKLFKSKSSSRLS